MKSIKGIINRLIVISTFFSLSITSGAQISDSTKCLMHEEIDYIAKTMTHYSVDPFRGIDSLDWQQALTDLHFRVNQCQLESDYPFILRRFGQVINDGHFVFPQKGIYSRSRLFGEDDYLFPVWIKVWTDGSVFVRQDLSGEVPPGARLLSINGHSAKDLAEDMMGISYYEPNAALFSANSLDMIDPYGWNSFINYLFCEKIHAPFSVEYEFDGKRKNKTLDGERRGTLMEWYDTGPGREVIEKDRPKYYLTKLGRDAISYHTQNDSIAVLKIRYWMGGNLLQLMLTRGDPYFKKKLSRVMDDVITNDRKYLVIDIRGNGGGYLYNVIELLSYFTKQAIPFSDTYRVSDENRKEVRKLLKKTFRQSRKGTAVSNKCVYQALASCEKGSLFRSDTLFSLFYKLDNQNPTFQGTLYVLTDGGSASASLDFAKLIKENHLGYIVGTSPGGYTSITGGNTFSFKLPFTKTFSIDIPYVSDRTYLKTGYRLLDVDLPLYPDFEEWLDGSYDPLSVLLTLLSSQGNNLKNILQ